MGSEAEVGERVRRILGTLPSDARAAAFIRHAERHSIDEAGEDAPLTDTGRAQARDFGTRLPRSRMILLRHSGMSRCVETANLIADAYNQAEGRAGAQLLGPGESLASLVHAPPFKENMRALNGRIEELGRGGGPPWKLSANEIGFANMVSDYALTRVKGMLREGPAAALHVFVDHDLHIIVIRERALKTGFKQPEWVPYLGGFVLALRGTELVAVNGETPTGPSR